MALRASLASSPGNRNRRLGHFCCCLSSPVANFMSGIRTKTTFQSTQGAGGTETIVISNDSTEHKATLIFMHGLGDTCRGWAQPFYDLGHEFPDMKFVLPTAPTVPVTLNHGMVMPAWYDIKGLSSRAEESCDGIDKSRQTVLDLIQNELDEGIPHSNIMVGGFSQGGALSYYTTLQYPHTLGGVLIMSGYVPLSESMDVQEEAVKSPMLICHGDEDPMVKLEWAQLSKEFVENAGVKPEWKLYPMGHSACPEEFEDIRTWMLQRHEEMMLDCAAKD